MNIELVRNYVKKKHQGQMRKQNTPYYLHPFAVADILKQKGYSEDYQLVGLCHDLLEDTDATYEEIMLLTSSSITNAVKLLTKEKNYQMNQYINQISKNEFAKIVKLADRLHNLSEAHYANLQFIQKYIKETEEWYLTLAHNTPFEQDIITILTQLKDIKK